MKMTEFVVAPLIAVPSFLYSRAAIVLLSSGLRVLKAFRERRLLTASAAVYALFRVLVNFF